MFLATISLSLASSSVGCDGGYRNEPTVPYAETPTPVIPSPTDTPAPPTGTPTQKDTSSGTSPTKPEKDSQNIRTKIPTAEPETLPTPSHETTAEPEPAPEEKTVQIPAYSTEPREVIGTDLLGLQLVLSAYDNLAEPPTVEELLEKGPFAAETSPVQIAFIGVPDPDSIRCHWRPIALTLQQREEQSRFWLGITPETPLPNHADLKRIFLAILGKVAPAAQDRVEAGILHLVAGGLSTEHFKLTCYADYVTTEYLLGNGPARVTVLYPKEHNGLTYDLYKKDHASGGWDYSSSPLMNQEEYQLTELEQPITDAESVVKQQINGRKSVVFLVPAGAQHNIAIEAWEVAGQWDIQDKDGETLAIRHAVYEDHAEHTQTLANLRSRTALAITTDAFAGKRIANISGLRQYYRTIGAYDDITPGDDSDATFVPAQPPPHRGQNTQPSPKNT